MEPTSSNNSRVIAGYVAQASARNIPTDILDAARFCLVDWAGVCAGAKAEKAASVVSGVAQSMNCGGRSTLMLGGSSSAAIAALCNGTLAHCLDFDDTYIPANVHTGAPVWAATLALS